MTENPPTVQRGTDLDDATRLLLTKRIQRLPVVDDEGRLVGVLSRGSLVKAAMQLRAQAQAAAN
jgi:CBS domain-containing protein